MGLRQAGKSVGKKTATCFFAKQMRLLISQPDVMRYSETHQVTTASREKSKYF